MLGYDTVLSGLECLSRDAYLLDVENWGDLTLRGGLFVDKKPLSDADAACCLGGLHQSISNTLHIYTSCAKICGIILSRLLFLRSLSVKGVSWEKLMQRCLGCGINLSHTDTHTHTLFLWIYNATRFVRPSCNLSFTLHEHNWRQRVSCQSRRYDSTLGRVKTASYKYQGSHNSMAGCAHRTGIICVAVGGGNTQEFFLEHWGNTGSCRKKGLFW